MGDRFSMLLGWILFLWIAGMFVLWFGLDERQFERFNEKQPISITWEQLISDCEELWEGIVVDRSCRADPSCTMTRAEFLAADERRDKYIDKSERGVCLN